MMKEARQRIPEPRVPLTVGERARRIAMSNAEDDPILQGRPKFVAAAF